MEMETSAKRFRNHLSNLGVESTGDYPLDDHLLQNCVDFLAQASEGPSSHL